MSARRPQKSALHMKMESDGISDNIKDSIAWLITSGSLPGVRIDSIWDGYQVRRLRGPNKPRSFPDVRRMFEQFYFAIDRA